MVCNHSKNSAIAPAHCNMRTRVGKPLDPFNEEFDILLRELLVPHICRNGAAYVH